jgi:hypothetical protein
MAERGLNVPCTCANYAKQCQTFVAKQTARRAKMQFIAKTQDHFLHGGKRYTAVHCKNPINNLKNIILILQ